MVATAMSEAAESGSYSLESVFLRLLVMVNDLDVLYANAEPNDKGELEQMFWVRERRKDAEPFAIPLYALQYWVKPKKDGGGGCIDWLLAGSQRTVSPELPFSSFLPAAFAQIGGKSQKPVIFLAYIHQIWSLMTRPRFKAPSQRMADVTWQQYRAISDYFEQWVKINNAVRRSQVPNGGALLRRARAQWLATIFSRRTLHRDRESGTLAYSFAYVPGQAVRNEKYFLRVSEVDFQMVLLWWEGMQHYLQHRYPKCFRRGGGSGGNDRQDPLSLYSRSIATLEKFSGSDEETINRKTYSVVLQQFNDMVEQNEEYEKMKR